MNRLLSLTLLLFVACGPSAESGSEGAVLPEATTDPAPAPAPPNAAKMTPIFHAAVVLEYDGKTIFIDPYDDPAKFSGFSAPDLVLVTHTHQDHFNRDVLSALDLSKATLIGQKVVSQDLGTLSAGQTRMPLDLGSLQSGIYLVTVTAGDTVSTLRVTKK